MDPISIERRKDRRRARKRDRNKIPEVTGTFYTTAFLVEEALTYNRDIKYCRIYTTERPKKDDREQVV